VGGPGRLRARTRAVTVPWVLVVARGVGVVVVFCCGGVVVSTASMRAETVPGGGVRHCASRGREGGAAGWAGGQRSAIVVALVKGWGACAGGEEVGVGG